MRTETVMDLLGLRRDPFEDHNRYVDAENEWLWELHARLVAEVEIVEQRITAITGITEFDR